MNSVAFGTVGIGAFLVSARLVHGPFIAAQCAMIIQTSMQTAGSPELCVLSIFNVVAILRQTSAS